MSRKAKKLQRWQLRNERQSASREGSPTSGGRSASPPTGSSSARTHTRPTPSNRDPTSATTAQPLTSRPHHTPNSSRSRPTTPPKPSPRATPHSRNTTTESAAAAASRMRNLPRPSKPSESTPSTPTLRRPPSRPSAPDVTGNSSRRSRDGALSSSLSMSSSSSTSREASGMERERMTTAMEREERNKAFWVQPSPGNLASTASSWRLLLNGLGVDLEREIAASRSSVGKPVDTRPVPKELASQGLVEFAPLKKPLHWFKLLKERGVLMEGCVHSRRVENLKFARLPDQHNMDEPRTVHASSSKRKAPDANLVVPLWSYNVSIPILHLLGKRINAQLWIPGHALSEETRKRANACVPQEPSRTKPVFDGPRTTYEDGFRQIQEMVNLGGRIKDTESKLDLSLEVYADGRLDTTHSIPSSAASQRASQQAQEQPSSSQAHEPSTSVDTTRDTSESTSTSTRTNSSTTATSATDATQHTPASTNASTASAQGAENGNRAHGGAAQEFPQGRPNKPVLYSWRLLREGESRGASDQPPPRTKAEQRVAQRQATVPQGHVWTTFGIVEVIDHPRQPLLFSEVPVAHPSLAPAVLMPPPAENVELLNTDFALPLSLQDHLTVGEDHDGALPPPPASSPTPAAAPSAEASERSSAMPGIIAAIADAAESKSVSASSPLQNVSSSSQPAGLHREKPASDLQPEELGWPEEGRSSPDGLGEGFAAVLYPLAAEVAATGDRDAQWIQTAAAMTGVLAAVAHTAQQRQQQQKQEAEFAQEHQLAGGSMRSTHREESVSGQREGVWQSGGGLHSTPDDAGASAAMDAAAAGRDASNKRVVGGAPAWEEESPAVEAIRAAVAAARGAQVVGEVVYAGIGGLWVLLDVEMGQTQGQSSTQGILGYIDREHLHPILRKLNKRSLTTAVKPGDLIEGRLQGTVFATKLWQRDLVVAHIKDVSS